MLLFHFTKGIDFQGLTALAVLSDVFQCAICNFARIMSRKHRETQRRSDEGDQLHLQQQQLYHEYETPLRVEADDANEDAQVQLQAQRPSALTIIVSPSPNQATDSHVNMNDDDEDDDDAMLDDAMPLSSSRRHTRKDKKSKSRAKKPRVDMHAFRTCIILAMPWAAYAVFSKSAFPVSPPPP